MKVRWSPAPASRRAAWLGMALMLLAGCGQKAAPDAPPAVGAQTAAAPVANAPQGEWSLVPAESLVSFVSVKNNAVAEAHRFTEISGRVSNQGKVELTIKLASVATGIEIRDQRLRDLLFEVATYPAADLTLDVDAAQVMALPVGGHLVLNASATLSLHGQSAALPIEARITRTSDTRWLVTSERPAIVAATNFELINGVEELRKVAGLQAIASAVPVTFTLAFATAP
jgi:polyisoprenoid-binding protein YceI